MPGQDRLFQVTAIKEKPIREYAIQHLMTPGLPPDCFLCHFGIHVFPPRLFDYLEKNIRNNVRENGEIQLTSAQDELRAGISRYYGYEVLGDRYDTGVPFGLMEAQFALALAGVHRHEIAESLQRMFRLAGNAPLGAIPAAEVPCRLS